MKTNTSTADTFFSKENQWTNSLLYLPIERNRSLGGGCWKLTLAFGEPSHEGWCWWIHLIEMDISIESFTLVKGPFLWAFIVCENCNGIMYIQFVSSITIIVEQMNWISPINRPLISESTCSIKGFSHRLQFLLHATSLLTCPLFHI